MINLNNPPEQPVTLNEQPEISDEQFAADLYKYGMPIEHVERVAGIERSAVKAQSTEVELARFLTRNEKQLAEITKVRKLVHYNDPVLVHGPTGTGKELLSKALHGDRKGKFVAINCAGMSNELMCSELFGHVKGSFTGAISDKVGLMQAAANGTLFLDEIGEMDLAVQAKLLRALQEKKVRPVGGLVDIPINCRIVSATNRDLRNSQLFRFDLYWRISTFEIKTYPIKDRPEDIPALIERFWPDEIPDREWPDHLSIDHTLITGNCREIDRIVKRYAMFGEMDECVVDERKVESVSMQQIHDSLTY